MPSGVSDRCESPGCASETDCPGLRHSDSYSDKPVNSTPEYSYEGFSIYGRKA